MHRLPEKPDARYQQSARPRLGVGTEASPATRLDLGCAVLGDIRRSGGKPSSTKDPDGPGPGADYHPFAAHVCSRFSSIQPLRAHEREHRVVGAMKRGARGRSAVKRCLFSSHKYMYTPNPYHIWVLFIRLWVSLLPASDLTCVYTTLHLSK